MKNHKVGTGRSEISTTHLVILIWFRARFVSRIMRDVVKVEQDYALRFFSCQLLLAFFSAISVWIQFLLQKFVFKCHQIDL